MDDTTTVIQTAIAAVLSSEHMSGYSLEELKIEWKLYHLSDESTSWTKNELRPNVTIKVKQLYR